MLQPIGQSLAVSELEAVRNELLYLRIRGDRWSKIGSCCYESLRCIVVHRESTKHLSDVFRADEMIRSELFHLIEKSNPI